MASPAPTIPSLPRPGDLGGHRSFTSPARLSDKKSVSSTVKSADGDIETLFESSKCKIVSFSPAIPSARFRTVSLGASELSSHTAGELPYGSNTERTIALGPLRVYRVPGSVAFLNSGKLVHPVLPKSSCWCVDGKTKFVLGVPGKKYYRIELPCENEDDQVQADDFKLVLAKISQYETTACPFKRGFHVELPEINIAKTKRPWKPKHAPGVISPWSPEGQQLADGEHIERLFPSAARAENQSPRKRYIAMTHDIDPSDSESTAESGSELAAQHPPADYKVPRLVATYDELAPVLKDDVSSDKYQSADPMVVGTSPDLVQERSQDNLEHEIGLTDVESSTHVELESYQEDFEHEKDGISALESGEREEENASENCLGFADPLGIITPSRLRNDDGRVQGIDWLGNEGSEATPTAAKPLHTKQAITVPVLPLPSPNPSAELDVEHRQRLRHDSEAMSLVSVESSSSFHSFHSPTSPVLHSPLSDSAILQSPAPEKSKCADSPNIHKRDASSNTITAATIDPLQVDLSTPTWPTFRSAHDENAADDDLETGTESDTKSYITAASPVSPQPPSPTESDRHPRSNSTSSSLRIRLRRRRTHSPMLAPSNLYIPPSSLSGHLTNMILYKTANLLLGPPVQLVALMLNLARRFADGKLKAETYTYGDRGQPIPCEWCDSDLDYDGNSSEEDDYGISIGGTPERRKRKQTEYRGVSKKDQQWALD